jgi:hypothetical protein
MNLKLLFYVLLLSVSSSSFASGIILFSADGSSETVTLSDIRSFSVVDPNDAVSFTVNFYVGL